jgi:hypothetical protein
MIMKIVKHEKIRFNDSIPALSVNAFSLLFLFLCSLCFISTRMFELLFLFNLFESQTERMDASESENKELSERKCR